MKTDYTISTDCSGGGGKPIGKTGGKTEKNSMKTGENQGKGNPPYPLRFSPRFGLGSTVNQF